MKAYFLHTCFPHIILALLCGHVFSQNPVNGFGNITAISGKTLTVNSVSETYDTFEDGEYVIIMQMQDDAIGTNTTNVSSFGNLGSIQSAGLFEVNIISSHTEVSGLPNTIVLQNALSNTYHTGANASVQIISYPQLGTPNYATSSNIVTAAWNGTIGGVTALYVPGTLTLNNSITANGAGFRGGVKNTPNGYSACDNATYTSTLAMRYAGKGEGIYKVTNTGFVAARGKILNGGGGGNDVNAGGGGGGNYSAGGGGGLGWVPAGTGCSPGVGGLGGLSLSGSINPSRVYLGGGGHENDGVGTAGGNGGASSSSRPAPCKPAPALCRLLPMAIHRPMHPTTGRVGVVPAARSFSRSIHSVLQAPARLPSAQAAATEASAIRREACTAAAGEAARGPLYFRGRNPL